MTFLFLFMAQGWPQKSLAGQAPSIAASLAKDVAVVHFVGLPGLALLNAHEHHQQQQEPAIDPFRPPAEPTKEEKSASKAAAKLRALLCDFLATARWDMTEERASHFLMETRYLLSLHPEHIPILLQRFREETKVTDIVILAEILYILDPNNLEARS